MKKKIIFVALPVLAVLVFVVIQMSKPSPSDVLTDFKEAVEAEDSDRLFDMVELEDDIEWSKEDAESMITYFKQNEDDWSDQMEVLNRQAAAYQSKGDTSVSAGANELANGGFYMKKEDGLFGAAYAIKAAGFHLDLQAPEDAEITFKDAEIDMSNKETKRLGTFGPGVYTIHGSKQYEYTKVSEDKAVTLFEQGDYSQAVQMDLTGEKVTVTSQTPETKVKVEGKDTEQTINETLAVGPIGEGMTVQGFKEFPWGEATSKSFVVGEDEYTDVGKGFAKLEGYDLTPDPVVGDAMKKAVVSAINRFAEEEVKAKKEQDVEILTNISDPLEKDYIVQIQDFDEENYFEGKALGTRIDIENASYEQGQGGVDLLRVPVEFHEESREVYEYIDTEMRESFDATVVVLTYDEQEKQWIIYDKENKRHVGEDYMSGEGVVKTEF